MATGVILATFAVPRALAVTASHWTHTTEADFKAGTLHSVVATNLGDVKLSRAVHTILEQDPKVSSVYALVEGPDKAIYAGTGPQGVLLQIKGDSVSHLAALDTDTSIFSLLFDRQGRLLIGTGGEKGRVLRISKPGEKPQEVFAADGVQYIWAMCQTPDGVIYVATGPNGQIFQINPDGTSQVLYKSDEHNILCLVSDGKDTLYAGTDPNGLVYRINRKTREAFVLYNAAESEISALVLDHTGTLYAGTAEASDQLPSASDEPGSEEKTGRPEGSPSGVPIPGQPPSNPQPPDLPNPTPGQPPRIPKTLLILPPDAPASLAGLALGDSQTVTPIADDEAAGDEPHPAPPGKPAPPGAPRPGHGEGATPPAAAHRHAPSARDRQSAEAKPTGNAIYRIDPSGFVSEVFRQPVLVLSLLEHNGVLLVGTGNEGLVYQLDPAAQESSVLAKVDPKQVMCLTATSDGRILMGLANVGGIAAISGGYADRGTFTSPVLDAAQVSLFGKIHLEGTLPEGTSLTVATRSGNMRDPSDAGWSKWSAQAPATTYIPITSPAARFLQYRLTFNSTNGTQTPVVDDVDVAYQLPNLPPQVTAIKIASHDGSGNGNGGGKGSRKSPEDDSDQNASSAVSGARDGTPGGTRTCTISWDASDDDGDSLQYSLCCRPADSNAPWVMLKDKLKETQYDWDTRSVADGRYQVRVLASDSAANPVGGGRSGSRVSDSFVVDNTPPAIGDLKWQQEGLSDIRIDMKVVDRTSTVAAADYSIDSHEDWQAVDPSDRIADSPEEAYGFVIPGLPPGPHQIAIRAIDSHGNVAFQTVLVTISAQPKPATAAAAASADGKPVQKDAAEKD
jgi:hypothetical protein